jgi:hypothetical protein
MELLNLYYLYLAGNGLVIVCLTVEKNVGMPENHIFMMDYMNTKKKIIIKSTS